MRGMIDNTTTWSYRIPFGLQWIFPIPIFFAVCSAPESPWWLIRQNRLEDARATLRRLRTKPATSSDDEFETTLTGAMETMIQTNKREEQMQSGTSYKDCFKGVDKRRTEITCMVWIIQTLCGGTFMGFSTYFCKALNLCTKLPGFCMLTIIRRTSWPWLHPRFHSLTRPVRSRPHWRFYLLGTNGTLRAAYTISIRSSDNIHLRAAHWCPILRERLCRRPLKNEKESLRDHRPSSFTAKLDHRSTTTGLHTGIRCDSWPHLLLTRF